MDIISFRKLKLFRSSEIQPRKPQPGPPDEEGRTSVPGKIVRRAFLILLIFVAVLSFLISYFPSTTLTVPEIGDIADTDIVAPSDLTIEDLETTAKRRIAAEEAVLPVYRFDPNVVPNTESKIRQFFSLGREWLESGAGRRTAEMQKEILDKFGIDISDQQITALVRAKFPEGIEESLIGIVGKVSVQGVILSKNLFLQGELERGFTLLTSDGAEKSARVSDIQDVKEARQRIEAEAANLEISARNKSLLSGLAGVFLAPNITFNKLETEARKQRARTGVETVFYTIKKGKVVVRKGDEVTVDAVKQIQLINLQMSRRSSWFANFAGTFLLFALLFITLWYYLKSILKTEAVSALTTFIMMGTTLTLSLVVYRLSIFLAGGFSAYAAIPPFGATETYQYAFPFQMGTLLFAFLTSEHIALIYAILNSLMAGYILGPNYYPMIFSLIGGIAAIYGIKVYRRQRRTATLRAGLFFVAPVNMIVVITFHLIRERLGGLGPLTAEVLMGILGGLLSAGLAFILLPVFENVFRFVTSTRPPGAHELGPSDLPADGHRGPGLLPPLARRGHAGRESRRGTQAQRHAGQGGRPLPRHRQDQDARVLHREQEPRIRRPQGPHPLPEHAGHHQPRQGGGGDGPEAQASPADPGHRRTASRKLAGPVFLPEGQGKIRPRALQDRRRGIPLPGPAAEDQGSRPGHAGGLRGSGLAKPQGRLQGQPEEAHHGHLQQLSPGRPARRLRFLDPGTPVRGGVLFLHPLRRLPPPGRVSGVRLRNEKRQEGSSCQEG